MLFGASAALCSLPHFLFGWTAPNSVHSSSISGLNPMAADANQSHAIGTKQMDMTCRQVTNYSSPSYLNLTDIDGQNQQCASRFINRKCTCSIGRISYSFLQTVANSKPFRRLRLSFWPSSFSVCWALVWEEQPLKR